MSVLVSTPYSSFDDYDRHRVKVHFISLKIVDKFAAGLSHLAAAPMYRRWIAAGLAAADWLRSRADSFDVIETTDFGLLFAPLAGMRDRPPLVVRLHGSIGQISEHEPVAPGTELDVALARVTEAAVLPAVDALHAHSPANAAEWESRLGREVAFMPAPLPLPPRAVSSTRGEFSGVVVGRIQSWKGPELLCRAFLELGNTVARDLRIAWVGRDTASGPEGQSMSASLAARYPGIWSERIVPVGLRTAREVTNLQASASFALVPSRWDSFNYALGEAMSMGCLTLGSTGAGSSYLIDHEKNGFRFGPEDPHALAKLLVQTLAMSETERGQIGAAARSTVGRELDPCISAAASLSAFATLNSSCRPALPGAWISGFFESKSDSLAEAGHLENVSIRRLASHLKTRVTRKLIG